MFGPMPEAQEVPRMRKFPVVALVAALFLGAPSASVAEGLTIHRDLPQDPLLVFALSMDDLTGKLDAATAWLARVEAESPGESIQEDLSALGSWLGLNVEDDLLAQIGPDVAVSVDLPPLDIVLAALQLSQADATSTVLAESGILAEVRDAGKLVAALDRMFESLSGSPPGGESIRTARIPLGSSAGPGDAIEGAILRVYYAVRGQRVAIGFSPVWVSECLEDSADDERLLGGLDYGKVFANLDEDSTSLTYANLPKFRGLIADSQIAAAFLQGSPEALGFLRPLLDSDVMGIGLGSTSVNVERGVRTTMFGPPWMSGTAASSSVLAALAVPSLLVASSRNKSRETLESIQSIAAACEHFSRDAGGYPGPTEGWVPVGRMAAFLEPIYISTLPQEDAWDNPILYRSDGATYRLLSTGPDGRMDRDWSDVTEPTLSPNRVGDIVVADGRILVLPRDLSD
jgi:type II secretory pathway pseudopilin PulG